MKTITFITAVVINTSFLFLRTKGTQVKRYSNSKLEHNKKSDLT